MSNVFGRQVVVLLTNKSGGGVIKGDVVVLDAGNNAAFTTTTSAGSTLPIGIAQETIANNAVGRVLIAGYADLVNVNASVTRGNYGKTHTVAKQATDGGSSRVSGTFCWFLTGGTTPTALIYSVDLAGAALTNPMTTAEDIIVGGASGTPARKAIGAAGGALVSLNSVLAYNSGTSMPANKVTGDRFWRTDLGMEFYWDGTRWLTTHQYVTGGGFGTGVLPFALTQSIYYPMHGLDFDIWVEKWFAWTTVLTTNNGTNYWSVTAKDAAGTTSLGSFTTGSGPDAANTKTNHEQTIGALLGTTSPDDLAIQVDCTKVLSPGNCYLISGFTYRLVGT